MPTRQQIYIALAVLLFLVILAVYFYRKGRKTKTLQYVPGELPGNPQSGNVLGASNDEIKRVANNLYADMSGFNYTGHSMAPYEAANLLNDNDLIKLYNTFNDLHQEDSDQTLTVWLSNERYMPWNISIPDALIARLKKLNCN